MNPGLFSRWQPYYAAHNIATFPVLIAEDAKKPAVTNYGKVGLPGSAELASKRQFAGTDAFGFMTGPRSKITVLDVDTSDEKILANTGRRHWSFAAAVENSTPTIGTTASGVASDHGGDYQSTCLAAGVTWSHRHQNRRRVNTKSSRATWTISNACQSYATSLMQRQRAQSRVREIISYGGTA